MTFAEAALSNLANPEPSYEWTRDRLVEAINEYIRVSLSANVNVPTFGASGTIEFPPAAPIPYLYSPNSGPFCGGIISYTAGTATSSDYDMVADKTRNGDGSFWENFFELIGRVLFRSTVTIAPYLTVLNDGGTNKGFSTPVVYTAETLTSTRSFYRYDGNLFTLNKPISEWRSAGGRVDCIIRSSRFDNRDYVWELVSEHVKSTAIATTSIHRRYLGQLKRTTDPYPGTFAGYIYGSLNFE